MITPSLILGNGDKQQAAEHTEIGVGFVLSVCFVEPKKKTRTEG